MLRAGFDPGQAADDLDRYDVTVVSLVPTMLKGMLDRRGTLSDSLRVVLLGGAPADDALIQRCENYSVPVHPTYGMTETASQVATARPADAFDRPGTVGRPLLWTEVTVLGDDGEPVAAGETGELVVSGPTVTPGYYGDNEDAFCPYGLRTGDVGYQTEDGSLCVVNRIDDRITSGGETIDPGAVVAVLKAHEAVEAAAVVGVPDAQWGERVTALVVGDDGLTAAAVDSHCRDQLADFKCPKTIVFADEIPRTASGSIDRPAVREAVAAVEADTEATAVDPDDTGGNTATGPPIESVEPDSGDETADDGSAVANRRPPSSAEQPNSASAADAEPIPDAETAGDATEPAGDESPIGDDPTESDGNDRSNTTEDGADEGGDSDAG